MDAEETDTQIFLFSEDFEDVGGNLEALFPEDNSRWSGIQRVNPNNGENQVNLSTSQVYEGNYALSIFSSGTDEILSKIDLEKNGLSISEGQTLTIQAHFFIEGEANIENLLLIDVECCSCWDPSVPNNQCPGVRLMLSGENNSLSIERGKIGLETIAQNQVVFPRNEWVEVRWTMKMSPDNDGSNQLFINGNLTSSQSGANMPNEIIFKDLFAEENIEFELQTPVEYERLQIGATANPTEEDIQLYIDNFVIEVTSN